MQLANLFEFLENIQKAFKAYAATKPYKFKWTLLPISKSIHMMLHTQKCEALENKMPPATGITLNRGIKQTERLKNAAGVRH